jgi:two-component sensor histidine kinase
LRINEDLGNKEGKASTIFALGEMYLKHGESIRALTYFNESLTIFEEIEVVPDILSVLNRISETEFQLGNITGAKIAGTRSLNSAQNLGFPEKIGAAAKVLVDVYQSEGNWKRALEMHRLHVEMRDSIRNQETEKNALQQKSNYEIGKQEEKIAVLTTLNEMLERDRKLKEMYLWKNTLVGIFMSVVILLLLVLAFFIYRGLQRQRVINELLERQKNEVTVKNAEKQAMLKEIHHRVKNNLQIVSSLLRFQSREVEDPKIVQMFEDAQNRIISMAMIHEKMYRSEDLKNINIQEHFTSLIEDLVEGYSVGNIIGLDVRVDKVDFGIKTLVPLGLVVNEIVNNSLKHAFNEGESGMINLHLRQVEGQKFEMTIGDNGAGFIKQETQRGLGTELIEIFVAQLDGSVEKFDNGGTQYVINFEVAD